LHRFGEPARETVKDRLIDLFSVIFSDLMTRHSRTPLEKNVRIILEIPSVLGVPAIQPQTLEKDRPKAEPLTRKLSRLPKACTACNGIATVVGTYRGSRLFDLPLEYVTVVRSANYTSKRGANTMRNCASDDSVWDLPPGKKMKFGPRDGLIKLVRDRTDRELHPSIIQLSRDESVYLADDNFFVAFYWSWCDGFLFIGSLRAYDFEVT
jgi:hypothetical protein